MCLRSPLLCPNALGGGISLCGAQGSGWCGPSSYSSPAVVCASTGAPSSASSSSGGRMRSTSSPTARPATTPSCPCTSVSPCGVVCLCHCFTLSRFKSKKAMLKWRTCILLSFSSRLSMNRFKFSLRVVYFFPTVSVLLVFYGRVTFLHFI